MLWYLQTPNCNIFSKTIGGIYTFPIKVLFIIISLKYSLAMINIFAYKFNQSRSLLIKKQQINMKIIKMY